MSGQGTSHQTTERKPLVSVIVLCYNQEDYIATCLDSVLDQHCPFDYEVIVGDDASSDRTPEICREYQQRYPDRIVLQLNESNKGITRNYFDCLQLARGRYIGDCGGDDFWIDSEKLAKEIAVLESHPDVSIVHSNWRSFHQETQQYVDNNGDITSDVYDPSDYGQAAVARFLSRRLRPEIVLSAACYRKSIIREAYAEHPELFVGQDIKAEDIPVTAFLLQAGPAYFMAENHLAYRVLSESVSHSRNPRRYYTFALDCFVQTMRVAAALGVDKAPMQAYCDEHVADYMHYAWQAGDAAYAARLHGAVRLLRCRMNFKSFVKAFLLRLRRK